MIIEGVFHRGEGGKPGNYLINAMYLLITMAGGLAILFFVTIIALGALRMAYMIF